MPYLYLNIKKLFTNNELSFYNSTNKFINIKNNDFFAFYYSNKYYIFKKTDTLNIDDTGIFEIQNKINIGKYATEGNFIFISDLSSTDIFFREKSEISILGKVFYIIEVT